MLSTHELEAKAEDLKKEFCILHLNIRDCIIKIDFEKFKFLVLDLLSNETGYPQSAEVLRYVAEIKLQKSSSDILIYLKTNGFVSYQNYRLLESIVQILLRDQIIISQLNDYIRKYKEYEQEVRLSQKADSIGPSGLTDHEFGIRANFDNDARHWTNYLCGFPWSIYVLWKNVKPGSIIMTYIALPCVVFDVLKDLTDPVILQELELMGVTVDFLPKPGPISKVYIQ